ncbi:MAG TPA: decaprenyl-phosphate phosphoribosyltransferase, partial [Anaerolineales bacterium]|nr:decaprenyl-phosphate phosphoribosyltransferase [Anaerolineales bacterium]
MLIALLKTMRPRQWVTKNIFIFAALVADKQLFKPQAFLHTLAGFALFCLISSCVYIFNDLADVEADRQHPEKKNRPIPSGKLPVPVARLAGFVFLVIALALAYLLKPAFFAVISAYFLINLAYSKWLKHVPILDVLIIAAGFVLRVHAGVTLISVERFSPWLYVVMTLLSLFLGFGKRRAELALLAHGAGTHRKVLDGYTLPLLDQYIMIVSGATIVAYSLYTFTSPRLPKNNLMMLTIPLVLFGMSRYLYLIHNKEEGGRPEETLLKDRPIIITVILWICTSAVILAFG